MTRACLWEWGEKGGWETSRLFWLKANMGVWDRLGV